MFFLVASISLRILRTPKLCRLVYGSSSPGPNDNEHFIPPFPPSLSVTAPPPATGLGDWLLLLSGHSSLRQAHNLHADFFQVPVHPCLLGEDDTHTCLSNIILYFSFLFYRASDVTARDSVMCLSVCLLSARHSPTTM